MSFAGAIQIHHVDPFRPCRFELARRLQRIRRHLVHRVKGTLIEPHRRAVFDIDRWQNDHCTNLPKFCRMPRPTSPLFSGWNWQPKIWSRQTIPGKVSP